MTTDTRTPEQLISDYELYCEGKAEIGEEPLDYESWLELEKDAYDNL